MTAGLSQLCPIIIPDPAGLDQSDHHRPIASEDWPENFGPRIWKAPPLCVVARLCLGVWNFSTSDGSRLRAMIALRPVPLHVSRSHQRKFAGGAVGCVLLGFVAILDCGRCGRVGGH